MKFVGAYKEITPTQVQGHVLITYLGFDKVAVSFIFEPIQDEPHSLLLYGTIVGNTITFTNDNCYALYGTGTKNLFKTLNSGKGLEATLPKFVVH